MDLSEIVRSSRKSLTRAGTPPTGELGALSHLGSFVCNFPHSPSNVRCNTNFLSEPFGDEVPQPHPPHDTSHPHSLAHNQYKRSLRSQDARQRRQATRIQRRAQARRAYRTWISHFPSRHPPCGKGSTSRIHNPKPLYGPTPQAPSQRDRQPFNRNIF